MHQRLPSFQEAFVIRMPLVLPVREEACLAGGIAPEEAAVFEPGFVLVKEASHGAKIPKASSDSNQTLLARPCGMLAVARFVASELGGEQIGGMRDGD